MPLIYIECSFILITAVVLICTLSADRLKTNSSAREHARGSDAAAQSRLMKDLFNLFKVFVVQSPRETALARDTFTWQTTPSNLTIPTQANANKKATRTISTALQQKRNVNMLLSLDRHDDFHKLSPYRLHILKQRSHTRIKSKTGYKTKENFMFSFLGCYFD